MQGNLYYSASDIMEMPGISRTQTYMIMKRFSEELVLYSGV